MSAVEVIDDAARLAAIEADWWDLWQRCASATPFQSPGWLLPWWDAFSPGELRVLTVRQAGSLVGLASLYIETSARGRRLLPLGIGISDYLDILIDNHATRDVAQALAHALVNGIVDCDVCELTELAGEAAGLRLPVPSDCEQNLERASACPVLTLPEKPEDLTQVIPSG